MPTLFRKLTHASLVVDVDFDAIESWVLLPFFFSLFTSRCFWDHTSLSCEFLFVVVNSFQSHHRVLWSTVVFFSSLLSLFILFCGGYN